MNITNHNSDKILTGSNYNDFINNYVGPVTINGLDGNDNIRNSFATTRRNDYVLINSGTGNDLISNDGKYATVNGDEDNDLIFNLSNNSTISGGTGDDTIANNVWEDRFYGGHIDYLGSSSGNNILFNYAEGDGNDSIKGFRANSTLSIFGGVYATSAKSGKILSSRSARAKSRSAAKRQNTYQRRQ